MKHYAFMFILLFAVLQLKAQDSLPAKNNLSFSMGYTHALTKDLYRSPFTYHSLLTRMDIRYIHTGVHSIHSLQGVYMRGTAKTSFSPLGAENHIRISYQWLYQIYQSQKWKVYTGASADVYGWSLNYFPELKPTPVKSWCTSVSMNASVFVSYHMNERNTFYLRGSLALAGYVDRPDLMDGDKAYAAGLLPAWNPQVSLSWEHRLSPRISLLVRYDYSYLHTDVSRPLYMLQNGLSFGLVIRFGKK